MFMGPFRWFCGVATGAETSVAPNDRPFGAATDPKLFVATKDRLFGAATGAKL